MSEMVDDSASQQGYEYEEITIKRGNSGLGLTIAGGTDNPDYKNNNDIYITQIISGGIAAEDGRLQEQDIILKVGDIDLIEVQHAEAVEALKNAGSIVHLLVKREKPLTPIATTRNNNIDITTATTNDKSKSNNNNSSSKIVTTTTTTTTNNSTLHLKGALSDRSLHTVPANDEHNHDTSDKQHANNNDTINIGREIRTVVLTKTTKGLGFKIIGGISGEGIYISYLIEGGAAKKSNKLYCGDRILFVNGLDLRNATHEEAATALMKSGLTVTLVVRYRPEGFKRLNSKLNDLHEHRMTSTGTLRTSRKRSLYARAMFDYDPSRDSGLPSRGLPFKFGDILHIINASDDEWWQARKVLDNGEDDCNHGIIPSIKRIERRERVRLKTVKFGRNGSDAALDRRRKKISFSRRFPFMKSRENVSEEWGDIELSSTSVNRTKTILTSSSTISINNGSESGSCKNGPDEIILSYEPVVRQDINYFRPVILFGPLKDELDRLNEDLLNDNPDVFASCVPHTTRPRREREIDGRDYHFVSSREQMEHDIQNHLFIEAGQYKGNLYGKSVSSVRDVAEAGKHCILDVSANAIKRLHAANLYPIAIFIKPKSIESIIEMNKRMSHEEAIAAMDRANKLEQEFGTYFTATVQGDTPEEIYNSVLDAVSRQSGPKIWIPCREGLE